MAANLQSFQRVSVLECRVKAERRDHPNDSFLQDVDWLIQELRESWDHETPKSLDTDLHP